MPTSHLLEIHPNIIHSSTPRFPQWSLSLRFPHQEPIHPPLLTHTRHMPSPSHSSRNGESYSNKLYLSPFAAFAKIYAELGPHASISFFFYYRSTFRKSVCVIFFTFLKKVLLSQNKLRFSFIKHNFKRILIEMRCVFFFLGGGIGTEFKCYLKGNVFFVVYCLPNDKF